MTLILYGHLPQLMFALSDRRLTNVRTRKPEPSPSTKVTLYPGMWIHYTGLSKIAGVPTDLWLAQTLEGQYHLPTGLFHLRDKLTEAFRLIRAPASVKRHAFVGVGWVPADQTRTQNDPVIITVSNFATRSGTWMPEAEDEFTLYATNLRVDQLPETNPRFVRLRAAGVGMTEERRRRLGVELVRIVDRVSSPNGVRFLAEEMRFRSTQNGPVGGGQIITIVPHPDLGHGSRIVLTPAPPMISNPRSTLEYFETPFFVCADRLSYALIPEELTTPEWPPVVNQVVTDPYVPSWTWADFLW